MTSKKKFKVLEKDHPLMIKVRKIEGMIDEVCHELGAETGCLPGWSIAKELAAGADINELIEAEAVELAEIENHESQPARKGEEQ